MHFSPLRLFFVSLAGVAVAVVGGYMLMRHVTPAATPSATTEHATSSLSGATYTLNVIPTTPAPDPKKPIAFAASVSTEVRAQLAERLVDIQAKLAAKPEDFSSWVALSNVHKQGGDYATAVDILNYLSQVSPKNFISFYNAGDLYQNFIKDYPKAETNYLAAIANTPTNPEPYRSLYTLYTYQYKTDTTSAERILLKGAEAIPQATDLRILLAQYYRAHNQPTQAGQQYDLAIAAAQKAGNTALVAQLQAEKAQP